MPGDPRGSAVRSQQRRQQPYGGRLPGAVRPEQSADGALGDGQIQSAQDVDGAEAFLQTFTKYSVRSRHALTIAHCVRRT
ncbi:hypothetical protein ACQ4WX_13340 [Streptomyces lasalocidi]